MSITIKDIAKHVGVSYSTVSKALNDSPLVKEATKSKILKKAKELGYEPNYAAQALVSKETKVIGLIWSTIERVAPSALLTRINDELQKNNYSMIVAIDNVSNSIDLFKRFSVDGIILFNMPNSELLSTYPLPVITYGVDRESNFPIIDVNYEKAIYLAVDYLHELGHEHISFVGDFSITDERQIFKLNGFKKALKHFSMAIYDNSIVNTGGLDWYDGYTATNRLLLSSKLPTAIIGASYDITSGIIRSLRHNHYIIPKDMSVISYDNVPQLETLEVPVTSVGVPVNEIAKHIVETLLQTIQTPGIIHEIKLTPIINERVSCARRRK